MRVLTLTNPHAALLVGGAFSVTVRSKPKKLGRWCISAAKPWSRVKAALCGAAPFAWPLHKMGHQWGHMKKHCTFAFGAIVGEVHIEMCIEIGTRQIVFDVDQGKQFLGEDGVLHCTGLDYSMNEWTAGEFALVCRIPRRYAWPIPHRGAQNDSMIDDRLTPGREEVPLLIEGDTVGERVASMREQLGISVRRLAARAGTSFGYLAQLELGQKKWTKDMIRRVSAAFVYERPNFQWKPKKA